MDTKKKANNTNKNDILKFRLTEAEKKKVRSKAKKEGKTLSEYVRSKVL